MNKPKGRKVEKIGTPFLKGGMGTDEEIRFRGKEYTLFRNAFRDEALRIGRDLKADGYDVRFTNATFDGTVLNVYSRPAPPKVPAHRYTYGKRPSISMRSKIRISPKRPRLRQVK